MTQSIRTPRGTPLRLAALLLAAGAPRGAPAQEAPPSAYAIRDARVVVSPGRVLERATVVVGEGLIRAVGAAAEVPAGARVVDGSGLTVYPGLVAALSTVALPAEDAPPVRSGPPGFGGGPPGGGGGGGAPPSRGPEDRPATYPWISAADRIEVDAEALARWRAAGFTAAVTAPTRGFFSGSAAAVALAGERAGDMVLAPDLAQRFNLSGGPGHRGYPSSLAGAIAYARQLFLDGERHALAEELYRSGGSAARRPRYDRALDALAGVRSGRTPLLLPGSTATEIRRALRLGEGLGVRPILYGVQGGYAVAGEVARAGVPALVDADWPRPPRDADPEADEPLETLRHRLLAPTTPARLREAGVPFALYAADPERLLAGARKAVAAGLSPEDALRALTLAPAEIFDLATRIGTVEAGKVANLTVSEGDLLAEGSTVRMVFVDGRMFSADGDRAAASARGGRRPGFGPRGGRPGGAGARTAEAADRAGATRPDRATGTDREGGAGGRDRPSVAELRRSLAPSHRGPYRDDAVTLLRGATLLTVTGGTIENGSVLVRDGTIAEIGTGVAAPPGAHVVDARGKWIVPGIIDAHSHIAGGFNEGSVNVSSMTRVLDVLNPDDVSMYRALAGGVTAVNVLHGSANPIGGQNAVIKMRWGAPASELPIEDARPGIKFALGENPKRGGTEPDTRMGVIDMIRAAFVEAEAYRDEWRAYEAGGREGPPPRRDLKLEALREIVDGERDVHAHAYRADEILQLLRLAEEFGFRVRTLQHVLEGYKVAREIARHGAGASTFSDWWGYKVEAYDAIPYNAALMVEAGVDVSINSDSNEEMRHLNQEAAKTVKWGGLSEDEALALVTIAPARQLGIDHRTGSIEVGKDADLVVFDRHPLDNFAVPIQTYVDGKLYFDRELDRARQEAIAEEKARVSGRSAARAATDASGAAGREGAATGSLRSGGTTSASSTPASTSSPVRERSPGARDPAAPRAGRRGERVRGSTALAFVAALTAATPPSPAAARQAEWETTRIAEGVYQLRWRTHNAFFVVTPEGVVAVDPISAEAARTYAREIRRLAPGAPLRAVVYSHDHADHATGARALMGELGEEAPIFAHRNALGKIRAAASAELPPPSVTFAERLVLEGERPVELRYLGLSHSDNMIVVRVPDAGVVFAVDFVTNDGVGFQALPDYHFPELFATLNRLLELDFETIVFGHGPPGDRATVRRQIAYYDDLRAAVAEAVAAGWSEERAAAEVRLPEYARFTQYQAWFPQNVRALHRWMTAGGG